MNPDQTPAGVESTGLEPFRLSETTPAEYDGFVRSTTPHPLWHLSGWERPLGVYGHRLHRLAVRQGTELRGVLPLVVQSSLLFGRRVVSLPWVDASGILARDADARGQLVAGALQLVRQHRSARLILREAGPVEGWQVERDDKLAMELPLPSDPDLLWKSFDPKVRNQVRKAEKSGLTTETLPTGQLTEFYAVYSRNMRDLGSPPHSLAFFEAVAATFPESTRVHVARHEGQVVGAGLTMANGVRMDIPWASSLQEFNRLCVNHALYWHMLRTACQQGLQTFYFGRSSRGSGPHHFKKQWGAVEVPLFWYSLDPQGQPQVDHRPPQESFGLAIRMWRKLPVSVARRLGPWLISQLD